MSSNRTTPVQITWTPQQVDTVIDTLAHLRLQADIDLLPKYPYFGTKPYPLGRCKEIRDAVFGLLQIQLKKPDSEGLMLLHDALIKGASLTKAWGSLRDLYFQNALILGNWYLDVSNDTVNPNKPRVEVLPVEQSGFNSIRDFEHFAYIAKSYWGVTIYRNTVCPALAPFLPFLYVKKDGTSWMGEASDDMLAVAMNSEFTASERILTSLPTPPKQIELAWVKALSRLEHHSLLHAKGDPTAYCDIYRGKHYYKDSAFRDALIMAFLALPKSV
ncbi:hypothetical protein J9B83_12120 [Marinomonas sp. A79]|uniref:Uncharacterized protein n=1 Tax=Marinomonas vulgaris TaxID=2823372 RepID=A0ABS5HDH0_9GAMM|nr:hypothetical protein [Marinomonas vulgaris]MBR7889688.1 hypothetical protein [Marinomonas vulgaris]